MRYDIVIDGRENWVVAEDEFSPKYVRKYESIMGQGNGYMGLRASTEETYPRNAGKLCVAGTFNMKTVNLPKGGISCELPNCADLISVRIELDGEAIDLSGGDYSSYLRTLDLYNGLLTRSFTYKDVDFRFERFVSLHDRHLAGQRIRICPRTRPVEIKLAAGIGVERYGEMHFNKTSSRKSTLHPPRPSKTTSTQT